MSRFSLIKKISKSIAIKIAATYNDWRTMDDEKSEFSKIPNEKYKKFFDKFQEINILTIKEWKPTHLLGYFSKKYQETYQKDYSWKFNSPSPSKCFEVWQISALGAKLSTQPDILKEYIDWVFETKVIKLKKKFTSISFLNKDEFVNEYKRQLLSGKNNINRSTILKSEHQDIFKNIGYEIITYGDLALLNQMTNKSNILQEAFTKLVNIGFDLNILNKVI